MRLSDDVFQELQDALCDSFSDVGNLRLVARCLGPRLQEITTETSRLPVAVLNLIEYAEDHDQVAQLIECARKTNPGNTRLARLEGIELEPAPTPRQIVDAGAGKKAFKDRLNDALDGLDSPGRELVAAKELAALLEGASVDETDTLFLALLGNVKGTRSDDVVRALAPVIARCLRDRIGDASRPNDVELNLARAHLQRIDLSGLDLHEADVAFADLRRANLENANLWRSRGYAVSMANAALSRSNLEEARWHYADARGAKFHDCRMVSVFLKDANLAGAEFQGSRLQGAHFERANLTGARFEGSNLADAYFCGAIVDDAGAASISRASCWQSAHFDAPTRKAIERNA